MAKPSPSQVSSFISHELKTPATCIKAYTQLSETEFATQGNAETKVLLRKMNIQMGNLTQLIDTFLRLQK